MIKIISNWIFASRVWNDAKPTPVAINLRDITHIEQICVLNLGGDVIAVYLRNNDKNPILIEGDIITVLAKFQEYLQNNV